MTAIVEARSLTKQYGSFRALDGVDLEIPAGAITGLIGPNGAGKTTTLKALIGLCDVEGELRVAGRDPRRARHRLMQEVCFIADVGILPKWMRANQAMDYVEAVHPRFDRARAERFLSTTEIPPRKRIRELSKGMVTQLHLALVMAIDVKLLVLDEPTLGLDIIYRKEFYDRLLNDYYDGDRTIIISTHQVEEIETLLSHLIFINKGRIVLDEAMHDLPHRFAEVIVSPEHKAAADALQPIHRRSLLGKQSYTFEGVPRERLAGLGEVITPSVADLFVAKMRQGKHDERDNDERYDDERYDDQRYDKEGKHE
ncbi:MAG: ABC transporter ATP-binding protein [Pseudohongiellaceae bacterium]